jgi:Methyl-accepting chemotaxis protein
VTISNRPPLSPRGRARDEVIRAWLLEQARKGTLPRSAVGKAAGLPVFVQAVTTREGDDLVTKCCVVTGGTYTPVVVRVNLPKLAAALRARGMGKAPDGGDVVGGFGSFLKKVAKGVTHNAVTKAVGKVVGKVARSPIVQIANPMMAITTHTLSKATGGRGTVKGRLGAAIDIGTKVVVPNALQHVGPQALGALGIGAKTIMQSQAGAAIRNVARNAQQVISQGRQAAAFLKAGRLEARTALPLIRRAVSVRATVSRVAPKLAASSARARKVQAVISNIASRAKAGSHEAKQAAVAISAAAKMTDKISAAQQAAAGGNPGFVVTADGKIRRSPKGKFIRTSAAPMIETLYRGAKVPPLRGSFTAVAGKHGIHDRKTLIPAEYRALEAEVYRALVDDEYQRDTLPAPPPSSKASRRHARVSGHPAWGGDRDPGDEYDGPLAPVRYNNPTTWPDNPLDPDHVEHPVEAYEHSIAGNVRNYLGLVAGSCQAGKHGWKGAPGTTAAARDRAKALLELARARHHLQKTLKRSKVGSDMAHLMVGTDLGSEDVGTPPELTEASDGLPDVDLLVAGETMNAIFGGEPWGVGAHLMVSGEPWGVGAEGINSIFGAHLMVSGPSGQGTNELIGCGEPNLSGSVGGFPSYLLTSRGLRHPVIRRRFSRYLKSLTPKVRRRVMSRLPAIVGHNDRVSGAVHSVHPNVGHYGHGWSAVHGIPGGYELVGSHRAPGLLTP